MELEPNGELFPVHPPFIPHGALGDFLVHCSHNHAVSGGNGHWQWRHPTYTPPRCTYNLCLTPAAKLYQERTFVKNQTGTGPSITRSSQLHQQTAGQKKLD
jgi:hypothetical protein